MVLFRPTLLIPAFFAGVCVAAEGHDTVGVDPLIVEIKETRAALELQRQQLQRQEDRLKALEDRLLGQIRGRGEPGTDSPVAAGTRAEAVPNTPSAPEPRQQGVEQVGEAPEETPRPQDVAVLADQGGVITQKRRLTFESSLEYARADRNRVVFRGIEIPQSVLVGVFDINESRQDVLTAGVTARLGLTNRLELNARVPFVHRSDASVLSPVSASSDSAIGSRDYSVRASGIGDVEVGARYQLNDGRNGRPFLIAGLQVLTPTGTNPFEVPRDDLGNAAEAATGAGFWGVSPTLTALLPSDPAVLFGTIGYTYNFSRDINRAIGDTVIERVKPGGEPSFGVGIGVSLNSRTALSFGYSHTWSFGTETRSRVIDRSQVTPVLSDSVDSTTRDLQLGRYIFGVSYRLSPVATLNWNLEVGATEDAADVRTTFRVPFNFAAIPR